MWKGLMLGLALLASGAGRAENNADLRRTAKHLQDISVLIQTKTHGSGSGVAFRRNGQLFVLTNWHVVEDEREVDANGNLIWHDVRVVQESVIDGRVAARRDSDAEVVAFSDDDKGYDLAVLRVRNSDLIQDSLDFYPTGEPPFVGMPLYHVGCLNGKEAPCSFTVGVISQLGRVINEHTFDQVTVTNFPGSSGGGVFDTAGDCVGILTRRSGETLGYMTPVREIRAWAKLAGAEWVVDPTVPVPPQAYLQREVDDYVLPPEVPAKATKRVGVPWSIGRLLELGRGTLIP